MSRRHRPSKADRKPVTRRYVARVVERARQDIIGAVVMSATARPLPGDASHADPMLYLDDVERRLRGRP